MRLQGGTFATSRSVCAVVSMEAILARLTKLERLTANLATLEASVANNSKTLHTLPGSVDTFYLIICAPRTRATSSSRTCSTPASEPSSGGPGASLRR